MTRAIGILVISLVEYAQINRGQKVLDIATGIGMVAIAAAQMVGLET
ncbi:hypothetical protein VB735_15845 [Halotia wernerae UHCC 0503]|nr:hypothetical protein [Halotia wernerae UHCC 0503]